jgi:hypothetical protein
MQIKKMEVVLTKKITNLVKIKNYHTIVKKAIIRFPIQINSRKIVMFF